MHDKRFGLRVLIGIVIGIIAGLGLLFTIPVGVQPDDVFAAEMPNGEIALVKVPGGTGPVTPEFDKFKEDSDATAPEFSGEVDILGQPMDEALGLINSTSSVEFTSASLDSRKGVSIRPWATEVIYIAGQIFLRLLKMLVIPLILATVLIGIASLGDIKKLGKLGGQTAAWYLGTMAIAVVIGVTMVNLIKPGKEAGFFFDGAAITDKTASELILKTIPTNPIEAIATGDIVGMLFFVILFALAMLQLGKRRVAPVYNFFEGLNDVVYVLVSWVMTLAPFGVGALIAHTIATQDVPFLQTLMLILGLFAVTVISSLALHWLFLLTLVSTVGKFNPIRFLKIMTPAFATAYGTNSSSATMPVTMRCTGEMGVSRRIRSFVVPVGATLNMDGTALFEAVAVLFFAQAFGVDLGPGGQLLVAVTSVVAAIGAAGIPSAGLVTMTIVLSAAGLPTSKMQLLWSIDRPLDMLRTVVNVTGDAVTSRVVQTLNPDIKPEEDDEAEQYEVVEPEASHDN